MAHSNIGRTVDIPSRSGCSSTGTVTAERFETRRRRECRIVTVRAADGTTYEQDARYTDFAMGWMDPTEALAELYLDEALDKRLGLDR